MLVGPKSPGSDVLFSKFFDFFVYVYPLKVYRA
jgi:hypothetical protein